MLRACMCEFMAIGQPKAFSFYRGLASMIRVSPARPSAAAIE